MKGTLLAALALAGLSCASQVLTMDRTSSGAIDRDADFTPVAGSDGHFISLPAYPLANCADALIYDRLVADLRVMAEHGAGTTNVDLSAVAEPTRKNQLRAFGEFAKILDVIRTAKPGAGQDPRTFDNLVAAATRLSPAAKLVAKDDALQKAAQNFVALASGFGATPCAASQQYHNYFGYVDSHVSWIDRGESEQSAALVKLASDVGIDSLCTDPSLNCWPKPTLSFLHFSDVQIREPGSKLGGAKLSHQLKKLVSSFEQDYVQEQNAMFVYDAIVKTANAEICLGDTTVAQTQACTDLVAKTSRPLAIDDVDRVPPSAMINTGDSADTGLQSEFDTFMTYTNRLLVPWYQGIGNHDVLAFGNLKMSSLETKNRPDDDRCQGDGWDKVPCTCTNLDTLVRAAELRHVDNHGVSQDAWPNTAFTLFPLLVQRICLLHAIEADWFVMDPDKQRGGTGTTTSSFVFSHCQGWRPRPGAGEAPPAFADCTSREKQRINAEQGASGSSVAEGPPPSNAPKVLPPAPHRYAYAQRSTVQPLDDAHCAVLPSPPSGFESVMHGFDLGPKFDPKQPDTIVGYYCFEVRAVDDAHRAWAVVLDTNTDKGAYGFIDATQLDWLGRILPGEVCDPAKRDSNMIGCNDMVMVFSHHPIWAIYDQQQRIRLNDIVTRRPNIIAYFAGHTHESGLRTLRPQAGSPGHAKMEIVAPSVIDYPEAARQVTIKTLGELGYIEVLTFTPHGKGSSVEKIDAALAGAIRDKCETSPESCDNGRVRLPGRDVTFPRVFFRTPEGLRKAAAQSH